ncbi:hypothetical protein [Streptomyces sp. NPDC014734]|uniref:protein kinase domain-containing protein n=1 Tax=Streptomyces sp. NPDC014734 TaxID=3364886 RepID=UPI0036F90A83
MADKPIDDRADGVEVPREQPHVSGLEHNTGTEPVWPSDAPTRVRPPRPAPGAPPDPIPDPPREPPTRVRPPDVVPPDAPTAVVPPRAEPPTRTLDGPAAHHEFPQGLRERYEPLGVAGSGSEGTVWYVRRLADGTEAALKVAHPGQTMNLDTLEHLSAPAFVRHVPRIHEFGEVSVGSTARRWVALEYLPKTLDDHLVAGRADGDRHGAEETVRELADLLDFWQNRIDRNPLDLKPANIMVRPRPDGHDQFVVADFGGIARFTASQSYHDFQITALYMAPEQIINQNLKATPWWTLGLVLYQVFTGRPLYVLGDDARITDEAWTRKLILSNEVDLGAVTDARQNLLLQGLLTKDPDDRWTAAEVRRWLRGESPAVVRPSGLHEPPAATRHANRPVTFRGEAHHEAESLAAAMALYSEEAAKWLSEDGGPRLAAWLRDDLEDTSYDSGQLLALRRGQDKLSRAAVAALAFVAVFAPTATPRYRGRRVDAEGIARIARGDGADRFVDELLAVNVPTVAARFVCRHDQCLQGRCQVLLTLADELRRTLVEVRARARTLRRRDGSTGDLDARETESVYGLATELIVHPGNRGPALLPLTGLPSALAPFAAGAPAVLLAVLVRLGALCHRALAVLRRRTPEAGFLGRWAELHRRAAGADPRTVRGRADLVAAAVLLPRARNTDANRRARGAALASWWSDVRRPLLRRLGSAGVLVAVFWLLFWSGAVLRAVRDTGLGWEALRPDDALVAPLSRAADLASATQTGLFAVALAGAVMIATAPVRAPALLLLPAAALATWVGYARPDLPPLGLLHAPDLLAERLRHLEGGWRSWNGLVALVFLPLLCLLLCELARRLLTRARKEEEKRARSRRKRARKRRARAGLPAPQRRDGARWRRGSAGALDRVLFVLAALPALSTVLWTAVETRVALGEEHRTLASWGTGGQGASYQSQYLLACAAICLTAAVCGPKSARRLLGWALVAVAVFGLLPPPVEPAQAVSVPVLSGFFAETAATWGHGAFWAALTLALPLAAYAGGFAVRLTRPSDGR